MEALRQGEAIETGPLSASIEPAGAALRKDVVLRRPGQAVVDGDRERGAVRNVEGFRSVFHRLRFETVLSI